MRAESVRASVRELSPNRMTQMNTPSGKIFVPGMISAEELKRTAQKLTGNNVFNAADAAKAELDKLGLLIAQRMDCILSTAPVKRRDRAEEKVHKPKEGQEHLAGDWLAILKDYARITLCPRTESPAAVEKVGNLLIKLMSNEHVYGYGKVKGEETVANKDPCGYSGFNFVLRFGTLTANPSHAEEMVDRIASSMGVPAATRPRTSRSAPLPAPGARSLSEPPPAGLQDNLLSHHLPGDQKHGKHIALDTLPKIRFNHIGRFGEIQVNTMSLLYAKASKGDFIALFGAEKYMACKARFGVEGGLGHVLYEHYRSPTNPIRTRQAAALSNLYYARMRGHRPPNPSNDTLRRDMEAYIQRWGSH